MIVGSETEAMRQVNAVVAERSRRDGGPVAFVCECGECGGKPVRATLHGYDLIRARDGLILAAGHGGQAPVRRSRTS